MPDPLPAPPATRDLPASTGPATPAGTVEQVQLPAAAGEVVAGPGFTVLADGTAIWQPAEDGPADGPAAAGYRMVRRLGRGTFGEVWLAHEVGTGLAVAIKFFVHTAGRSPAGAEHEVGQLVRLGDIPRLVKLFRTGLDARPPYFVMQYVPGGSLAERVRRGPVPPAEAVRLVRLVAEALAGVHAKGIIHCDLKPANVLLDAAGDPLVADLGQAHLAGDLKPALGTFFYMPPEQADHTRPPPDTRWDVHALGAILYELLIGRAPRRNATLEGELGGTAPLADKLRRYRDGVRAGPPPAAHRRAAGVDRGLARLVDRCLHPDPDVRPRDAAAVAALLRGWARWRHDRPLLATAAVATVLLPVLTFVLGQFVNRYATTKANAAGVRLLEADRWANTLAAKYAAKTLQEA